MTATHARQQPRRLTRRLITVFGTVLALLGVGVSPVYAATLDGMLSFEGFHVGAFQSSNGAKVYCLEPGAISPDSAQLSAIRVHELPAYSYSVNDPWGWSGNVTTGAASGETLRQMNWVLSEHGHGANAEQAVAVQIALWELRRGAGNSSWIDGKLALLARNGGQQYVNTGVALAQRARLEAKGPGNVAPSAGLTLASSAMHGNGTVSFPAGTTSLSIEGGVFSDGTTIVALADDAAGSLGWTANSHEPTWNRLQQVTVSGSWAMQEQYWPAEIVLHPPSRDAEQRLGAGIAPVSGTHTGTFDPASLIVDNVFAPRLTTQVPHGKVAGTDATFSDVVTVSSGAGGAPWPSRADGTEYLPLHADGTLFGPFAVQQSEQPVAPEGAPIAARTSLLLDRGPGSYPIDLTLASAASGYYYWVWEISEQSQVVAVRESGLLERGSLVADRFGVREEGQLVPTELRWVTQLKHRALQPGSRVLEDSVRVSLRSGLWLQNEDGEQIPANMRFTVYQTDQQPVRQLEVPVDAREIGQMFMEVAVQDTWIDAPPFEVPAEERGWVSVRACVLEEDQDEAFRGLLVEWCDDFGVPEETAELLEPKPKPALAETGRNGAVVPFAAGLGIFGMGVMLLGGVGLARRNAHRP